MSLGILEVGEPWPLEALEPGGTRVEAHHDDANATLILAIDISDLPPADRRQVLSGPVVVRSTLMASLTVFILTAHPMIYDLPFSAAVNGLAWRDALCTILENGACTIFACFVSNGIVVRIHSMKTTEADLIGLATAIRIGDAVSEADYNRAVETYQARWSPNDLLALSMAAERWGL